VNRAIGRLWLSIFSIPFFCCNISFFTKLALADDTTPLKELQKDLNRSFRRGIKTENKELYGAKWLELNTNLTKIFISKDGGLKLLEYLGESPKEFTTLKVEELRKIEYVGAQKTFVDEVRKNYTLRVLLAHPKYIESAKLGLIKAFDKQTLASQEKIGKKEIQLKEQFQAYLLILKNGSCAVTLTIDPGCYILIQSNKCDDTKALLSLANNLDYLRLSRKINS
jgi:hypothetical protein